MSAAARALSALVLVALSAMSAEALAHGFAPAYLELLERPDGRVEALWKVPLGGEGGVEGREPVEVRFPSRCHTLGRRDAVGVPGAVLERYALDCGAQGLGGATLSLVSPEGRGVDVMVSARFSAGQRYTGILRASSPSLDLPSPSGRSAWSVARSYLASGVEHIATGADHLLFVLGLLLLVKSAGALVRTVTAFTVGHSVTLALATLGVVHVPQAPVEATIALSIVLLAVERAAPDEASPTWTRRAPWLAAASFGLLHGFGFAGALTEAGLPAGNVPLALLFFNVGVEVGQVAFVALCLAALHIARRALGDRSTTVRSALVLLIGSMGTYWFLERATRIGGWFGG